MPDQKIDNLLNLAMDATSEERAKSENLNVGYDSSERSTVVRRADLAVREFRWCHCWEVMQ